MDHLKNKRIAVTGGEGFLGKFVVRELEKWSCVPLVVKHETYDLIRQNDIQRMLNDLGPDMVIHLAAVVGGIGANRAHPGRFFYDNLMMGVQLMEESRVKGVEKFVTVGTVCAYPKHTLVPFLEESLWDGYPEETNAPYGLAKKMLLVQGQAYREEYDFNAIYLIPVNLYGPGDNFDLESSHVIPALIRKFVEGIRNKSDRVVCWGTGRATREFLYVEDAARAIVGATASYNSKEPVNIGTGQEISIKALAEKIAKMTNYPGQIIWDNRYPDGQPRRCLNVERARSVLGFCAQTSLEAGLAGTIEWYLKQLKP